MFLVGKPLIVHGVTVEEWTRRYGVEPFTAPCGDCGRPLTTTIPFAQGQLRGLKAPPCECGQDRAPYVVVRDPKYGDLLQLPETKTAARRKGAARRSRVQQQAKVTRLRVPAPRPRV